MDRAAQATPTISDDERRRRQKAVDYARGSVRLEGFVLDDDINALNQRYVDGELTSEELTAAIKRTVGQWRPIPPSNGAKAPLPQTASASLRKSRSRGALTRIM